MRRVRRGRNGTEGDSNGSSLYVPLTNPTAHLCFSVCPTSMFVKSLSVSSKILNTLVNALSSQHLDPHLTRTNCFRARDGSSAPHILVHISVSCVCRNLHTHTHRFLLRKEMILPLTCRSTATHFSKLSIAPSPADPEQTAHNSLSASPLLCISEDPSAVPG